MRRILQYSLLGALMSTALTASAATLAVINVPETGSSLVLLSLALAGIGLLSLKRR